MTSDPSLMTAADLTRAYRRRSLSPVEVVRWVYSRIRKHDPKMKIFVHLDEVQAIAAAQASEARYRKAAWLSPVDGVPATVKDLLLVRGWPTLRGSTLIKRNQSWDEDAPSVARLREAGAVLIGKTTTPEFGWKGVTDSRLMGITRNPWDLERTSGGSSGGAAVAAALGMGVFHLGTDGGGSIRIPASFTGIFGLKPSFGRVPAYPASPFAAVAHVGPMARTVTDAAELLTVIARPDMRDPYALPYDGRDWTIGLNEGVAGLRIGYAKTINGAAVEPGVAAAVDAATAQFQALGAEIELVELSLPGVAEVFAKHWLCATAALRDTFDLAQWRDEVDPGLQAMAEAGSKFSASDYIAAAKARDGCAVTVNALFEHVDLLLTPTMPITAFEAGRDTPASGAYANWPGWSPFSHPFNLSKHPAASIPCGFVDGLPVGLQLVGPSFRDDVVLRAARAYESLVPITLPTMT